MTKRGYKNPPVEHQFQKGKSGNPKGRPRKKKHSSSDPGLDLIASVHRELGKTISVQENGQHKKSQNLTHFLPACCTVGEWQTQSTKNAAWLAHTGQTSNHRAETLEQLQSYDEDRLNELYEQLNATSSDTPKDGDDQRGEVDD